MLTQTSRLTGVIALWTFAASAALADSDLERDLKRVQSQREDAVAAAVEPINRRYQAALEQLLRRATQTGELDTALKIKNLLAGSPGANVSTGTAASRGAVEKALPGEWDWVAQDKTSWGRFLASGRFQFERVVHAWKVAEDGTVTITRPDKDKATLRLSSDLQSFTGTNFDGSPLSGSRRN